MFTGLVEKTALVSNFVLSSKGAVVSIFMEFDDVKIGDSIALNGACLTVSKIENSVISMDIMNETLSKTNLKFLKKGSKVNLERAMQMTSRFQGHIVSGHIDETAKVKSIKEDGFSKRIEIEADTAYIIEKGSVTLNGVSLTVSRVFNNSFEVSLIPETLRATNLSELKAGSIINVEFDILAKYVQKFVDDRKKFKITEEYLVEHGF